MREIEVVEEGKIYNITLTRGDSFSTTLNLTKGDEEYVPSEGSTIRFAMKEKYADSVETVLVKEIPIDTLVLAIDPEDTKSLPMKKKYVYDIQLTDETGKLVETFIKGTFTIGEEVD